MQQQQHKNISIPCSPLWEVEQLVWGGNSLPNSPHPVSNLIWKIRRGGVHILLQHHKKWAKRHLWNDHMLYPISIKTMALQLAVISVEISATKRKRAGRAVSLYTCLSAHTPQENRAQGDFWCCFKNYLTVRQEKKITKHIFKTHPGHTNMRRCVFSRVCIQMDVQVTKSKTSWMTREVGNRQIYLHVSW